MALSPATTKSITPRVYVHARDTTSAPAQRERWVVFDSFPNSGVGIRIPINTGTVAIESLGGYRLVRKLGEGPRAEVFLAHPHRVADDAIPAAIKIFRSGVPESEISREIEALSRGSGEHTVALLDLTTGPTGAPALILSRCASGSVARLLATTTVLFVGEAVTILAPIVGAVGRLHDAGVAHRAIRPEAVLFDAAGAPILGCFGHAVILTPGLSAAAREAEPALTTDLRALKQLVVTVLDRVGEDATGAVDWLVTSDPGDTSLARFPAGATIHARRSDGSRSASRGRAGCSGDPGPPPESEPGPSA